MTEITSQSVQRLQTAYKTAVESYVLYGEMDNEACYGRLEFIAGLLGDILDDLGVDVDDLAEGAVKEDFSPFASDTLDEEQAMAFKKVTPPA